MNSSSVPDEPIIETTNDNHEQDVESNSKSYSRRSLDRGRKALIDYLRDCKAPNHKRSLAHLWDHFCSEPEEHNGRFRAGVGSNHAKFPRMLIGRAIEELIDENQLYCVRGSDVVGSVQHNASSSLASCNASGGWIVYNPYPHQKTQARECAGSA